MLTDIQKRANADVISNITPLTRIIWWLFLKSFFDMENLMSTTLAQEKYRKILGITFHNFWIFLSLY